MRIAPGLSSTPTVCGEPRAEPRACDEPREAPSAAGRASRKAGCKSERVSPDLGLASHAREGHQASPRRATAVSAALVASGGTRHCPRPGGGQLTAQRGCDACHCGKHGEDAQHGSLVRAPWSAPGQCLPAPPNAQASASTVRMVNRNAFAGELALTRAGLQNAHSPNPWAAGMRTALLVLAAVAGTAFGRCPNICSSNG